MMKTSPLKVPALYGIIHAAVDASTVGLLYAVILSRSPTLPSIMTLLILYNALAFASQPIFGLLTDGLRRPRETTAGGLVLIIAGLLAIRNFPVAAVVLCGLGNAAFHVGGGVISLYATPKRAIGVGIFVAPGVLGLGLGTYLGKGGQFVHWIAVGIIAISLLLLYLIKIPQTYGDRAALKLEIQWPVIAVGLFFLSITGRALIGYTGFYTLEKSLIMLITLSLAAFIGKGLGGILADRFGWLKISVAAIVISTPLLVFNDGFLPAAVLGALLFQMTMPVTLTATAGAMPRFPGLAFGLNCLALFSGLAVKYTHLHFRFYNEKAQLISLITAAAVVGLGLLLVQNKPKHQLIQQ